MLWIYFLKNAENLDVIPSNITETELLADCRTSEESTAKQPNFTEYSAKIVKYVQYSHDFCKKSALFGQFFVTIPKARQPARSIRHSKSDEMDQGRA